MRKDKELLFVSVYMFVEYYYISNIMELFVFVILDYVCCLFDNLSDTGT